MTLAVVTGGAGFIGSALVRHLLTETRATVINLDKLTYAANHAAIAEFEKHPKYRFVRACITDRDALRAALAVHAPDAVMHLAAESHVDRSIDGPADFITTNIVGTAVLLETVREYLASPAGQAKRDFRFHHISTDEVFGSLGPEGRFSETSPYAPRSPYAASKAAIVALTRDAAFELASQGVRVNCVAPGLIAVPPSSTKTPIVTVVADGPTDTRPMGFGRPSDIANAVAFLLSTEARFIIGTTINVAGGTDLRTSMALPGTPL